MHVWPNYMLFAFLSYALTYLHFLLYSIVLPPEEYVFWF
jgi:hypothetical protein